MSKVYLRQIDLNNKVSLNNFNSDIQQHFKKLSNKNLILSTNAWLLLKEVLLEDFQININDLHIAYNEYGKPYFTDSYIHFNLSHSNDIIALVLANCDVGIDIECVKDIKNKEKLAKKINAKNDTNEGIVERFSALEAYYKKIGTGIFSKNLNLDIEITLQQKIIIDEKTYILSLALDENNGIEFIKWR